MALNRESVIRSAEKYVSKGKLEAAIKEYRKVLAENPNDANTLNRVGDLYARIERFGEAVKLFTQIAEQYTRDGFFVKAIAIYKKIIKLDPGSLTVYERLAELYFKQGLLNEARTQYQVLADYYQKHDNAASAISIFQKMSEIEPDNPTFHLKLAELYESQRLTDKALASYRKLADLLIVNGSIEEASRVFLRALDIGSDDLDFIRSTVVGLHEGGHVGAAAKILARAVEANPEAASVAEEIGMASEEPEPEPEVLIVEDEVEDAGFATPDGMAPDFGAPDPEPPDFGAPATDFTSPPALDDTDATFAPGTEGGFSDLAAAAAEAAADVPSFGVAEPEEEEDLEVFTLDLEDDEVPDTLVVPPPDMLEGGPAAAGAAGAAEELGDEPSIEIDMSELELDDIESSMAEVEADEPELESSGFELSLDLDDLDDGEATIGLAEPVSAEPVSAEPVSAEPVSAEPVSAEPVSAGLQSGEETVAFGLVETDPQISTELDELEPEDLEPVELDPTDIEAAGLEPLSGLEEESDAVELDLEALELDGFETEAVVEEETESVELDDIDLGEVDLVEAAATGVDLVEADLAEPTDLEPASLEPAVLEPTEQQLAEPERAEPEPAEQESADQEPAAEEAQPAGPPSVRREEDLMAEAQVFAKYGLEEKALDRLGELIELQPDHVEGLALKTRIYFEAGRHQEALAAANVVAEVARDTDHLEPWNELRADLIEAGYAIEDEQVLDEPEQKPAEDDRIAQLLEDLSLEDFESTSLAPLDDTSPVLATSVPVEPTPAETPASEPPPVASEPSPLVEPLAESPQPQKKLISLVEELGLEDLQDDPEEIAAMQEAPMDEAEATVDEAPAPAAETAEPVDLDETGMSWLDDVAGADEASANRGEALFEGEDDFFDLAAELERELIEDDTVDGVIAQPQEQSLEDIIEGFKQGVAENLSAEDYETHFNLGIAYREMGLLDEAIGEFQLSSKDERFLVDSSSLLGICFVEKGLPELAVRWYRKGLEAPSINDDAQMGLLYDMGNAYLSLGDSEAASKTFIEIYGLNSNYRDVSAKLAELGAVP